jgi:hypothetical protein
LGTGSGFRKDVQEELARVSAAKRDSRLDLILEDIYRDVPRKGSKYFPRGYALVTRPVPRSSAEYQSPAAQAALVKEVQGLLDKGAFSWSNVCEARDVRSSNGSAQFVRLHPIVVVKHVELAQDLQRFKARLVAGGNDIRNADGSRADPDLSTGYVLPPGLSGIRVCMAFGYGSPGGGVLLGDVDTAYVHARLGGPRMYARPDRSILPNRFRSMRDPVVPIDGALYGLPRAGWDWDQHCDHVFVVLCGWTRVEDAEGTAFTKQGVLAVVYIDDILLGGNLILARKFFTHLQAHIRLKEDDSTVRRIVGISFEAKALAQGRFLVHLTMIGYIESVVTEFKSLMKIRGELRFEVVPEFEENYRGLDRYEEEPGFLEESCRRFVGKILYLARAVRFDVLHAICLLARVVSKWTKASDMRMLRLVSYLYHSRHVALEWTFSNKVPQQGLSLYAQTDSDHAGEETTMRSTGGELLWLQGRERPGGPVVTKALVEAVCRRQDKVSSNTAEAEVVAAHSGLMRTILPVMCVLEQCTGFEPRADLDVDNDAARAMMLKGMSPSLKYLRKHRKVSLAATKDLLTSAGITVGRVATEENTSDILTKGLKKEIHERHFKGMGLIFPGGRRRI